MITAIIPTLNEERFVGDAIRSVSFADEVIVIDSHSTDRTVEIARSMRAKVIERTFDDFSSQKNHAISRASHDWILFIDADERVSEALGKEIIQAARNPEGKVGFHVFRNFYYRGRRIRYGGWQTDKVIRLFNRKHCAYNGNLVHETIETAGTLGYLEHRLDHYSFRDREHYASKLENYARLQAEQLYRENKKWHLGHLLVKPPFRFLVHYLLRLGFLDGRPGWVLAYEHARGVLKRYLFLRERWAGQDEQVMLKSRI